MQRIGVVGAGSWGTAIAKLLAEKGHTVRLWAYEPAVAEQITREHCNQTYLSDIALPATLTATTDLEAVIRLQDLVVLVTPSHVVRQVATRFAPWLSRDTPLVCCSKGIEIDTGALMSEVLAASLPDHPADHRMVLSGPTFAREVAMGQLAAVVIAGTNRRLVTQVQTMFRTPTFLPFIHHDVAGVEVGGAVKNVLAIATGVVEGMGLGHNTRAALMTRGLYEMIKIGKAYGAEPLTFSGLAGIGDLILTCTGFLSRNRQVGVELGKGRALSEVLAQMQMVAEGVGTAKAVHRIILRHRIFAPICTATYEVLHAGKSPQTALQELTAREPAEEMGALFSQ